MNREDRDARLSAMHARADDFFRRVQRRQPATLTCHAGCSDCCRVDLSVFAPEADRLRTAIAALPRGERLAAVARARREEHCALLRRSTGRCLTYADRPLICRTHGLAIRSEGAIEHCPRNYQNEEPRLDDILVMERLTVPYALLVRLSGSDGERVRIAELLLETRR